MTVDTLPIEISPRELAERLRQGAGILLIDVREPFEYEICRIAGSRLVPLGTLPDHLAELPTGAEIVVICHAGRRALQAAHWLRQQGRAGARSLAGGVDLWSREIDPNVPRY